MGQARNRREEIARLKEFSVISTQELMERLKQTSTVDWVDEGYADRLAKQLYQRIKAEAGGRVVERLATIRQSAGYLSETEEDGITTVWFLDYAIKREGWLFLSPFFYTPDGKWEPQVQPPEPIYLSPHSMGRIYQRLRTNSASDFKSLVDQLKVLGGPADHEAGEEFEVYTETGRFCVIRDQMHDWKMGDTIRVLINGTPRAFVISTEEELKAVRQKMDAPAWVVRTFIASKK
jgi:hypothetical protein